MLTATHFLQSFGIVLCEIETATHQEELFEINFKCFSTLKPPPPYLPPLPRCICLQPKDVSSLSGFSVRLTSLSPSAVSAAPDLFTPFVTAVKGGATAIQRAEFICLISYLFIKSPPSKDTTVSASRKCGVLTAFPQLGHKVTYTVSADVEATRLFLY